VQSRIACLGALTCFVLGSLSVQPSLASPSVGYQKAKIAGVWVNIVTADLNDPTVCVTPAVAKRGIGTSESFRSMIRRTRPAAAIDGTFFCTRTLKPTGDIVIDGQLVYRGYLGIAVAFGECNSVRFVDCQTYRWADYRSVLVAGPSLLLDGKMAVYPRDQGFCSGVHFSPRVRTGIGVTRANKLVLVTTLRNVYLGQFARVMRAIGCVDAAGLDGGSSTGLYYNGKLISNPSRGMTNCLLVYNDPSSYEQHRDSLCPANRYTKRPTDIP
jgi:exopolysaccharide biosynthesis protein